MSPQGRRCRGARAMMRPVGLTLEKGAVLMDAPEIRPIAEATVTLDQIQAAARRIDGRVIRTPLVPAPRLGRFLGAEIYLKLENHQYTGSFKDRGALTRLLSLTAEERQAGVIAMSAGNHAQGVAYHAEMLGIPAVIVMPETTPLNKVQRTRAFGAEVRLVGETIDDAAVAARQIMAERGLTFVSPYDDADVVAGQGTVGLEMIADRPDLDTIVVPIGGGGLMAGVATAVRALAPSVRLVGVEAAMYPSMYQAVRDGSVTCGGATIAEGIAVKQPGAVTRPIIERLVDDIVLVGESALESAVCALIEYQQVVAEGAGAAGIAALIQHREQFAGRKVGVVICGGNMDVRLMASVLMRGLVRDGRLVRLRIDIADQPNVLAAVAGVIGGTGGNIVEIYHQRHFDDVPAKKAEIDAVVETRNRDHVGEMVAALCDRGYPARVLSVLSQGDTAANLH